MHLKIVLVSSLERQWVGEQVDITVLPIKDPWHMPGLLAFRRSHRQAPPLSTHHALFLANKSNFRGQTTCYFRRYIQF